MSWSFTVNGAIQEFILPADLIEHMATQHVSYPSDMQYALDLAKSLGMRSAVCTGFRTPNPYGGPEVMEISVKGTADPVDLNEMMKGFILAGPECQHLQAIPLDNVTWSCPQCNQLFIGNPRG